MTTMDCVCGVAPSQTTVALSKEAELTLIDFPDAWVNVTPPSARWPTVDQGPGRPVHDQEGIAGERDVNDCDDLGRHVDVIGDGDLRGPSTRGGGAGCGRHG